MKKIIVLLSTLFVGVFVAAYFYFTSLDNSNTKNENALKTAIQRGVVTFSFNNETAYFNILNDFTFFNDLLGEDKTTELQNLKKLLVNNTEINKIIGNHKIFISLIPDGKNKMETVYMVQLKEDAILDHLISKLNTGGTKATIVNKQFKIEGQGDIAFYAEIRNNMAVVSANSTLVRDIIESKVSDLSSEMTDFLLKTKNSTQNLLANMYINYSKLDSLYPTFLLSKANAQLQEIANSKSISALNFNFSEDKLQFSGTTHLGDDHNYWATFLPQKPQKRTLVNIFPYNTANYTIYGLQDFNLWQQDLVKYLKEDKLGEKRTQLLEKITQNNHIDVQNVFNQQLNHEFATLQLNTGEKLGVIALKNPAAFQQAIADIVQSPQPQFFKFKNTGLMPSLFGNAFEGFDNAYFTIIHNQMVMANTISTLQDMARSADAGQFLMATEDYLNYSNQVLPEANISIFVNNLESKNIFKNAIKWDFFRFYIPDKSKYNQFYAFGMQLSSDQLMFQTIMTVTDRVSEIKDKLVRIDTLSL